MTSVARILSLNNDNRVKKSEKVRNLPGTLSLQCGFQSDTSASDEQSPGEDLKMEPFKTQTVYGKIVGPSF